MIEFLRWVYDFLEDLGGFDSGFVDSQWVAVEIFVDIENRSG